LQNNSDIAIFWFRRDLRLNDNCGLAMALQKHDKVLPIFIFDRDILDPLKDRADRRVNFIHRQVQALNEGFQEFGSGLRSFYGKPLEVFKSLMDRYNLVAVYTNRDYEPSANRRDHDVGRLLGTQNIPFFGFKDQVIFDQNEILTGSQKPYRVFTPYKRAWLTELSPQHLGQFETRPFFKSLYKVDEPFMPPTLESMGFEPSTAAFPSKELDQPSLREYHLRRDIPAQDATSHLSIHLRFGTVSIRELVTKARDLNETWLSELIWREFFMQILYHFPEVVHRSFRPEYDEIAWRNRPEDYEKWCQGQTGYPIVDAGMRELNTTGFMHNRVRMITASFLCKHLLIHWRWGERYFAEKLLDYDLSANNGNWQWAAGTGCDAAPYFRVFNPWTQAKKFDPENRYVERWVPEWQSEDYPQPMVDHKVARQRALETYKKGLAAARKKR